MLQLETFPSHVFLTPAVKSQNYHKQTHHLLLLLQMHYVPVWPLLSQVDPLFRKWMKTHSSCQLTCRALEFSGPQKNLWPSNWKPAVVLYAAETQTHVTLALLRPAHSDSLSDDNSSSRLWRRRLMIWSFDIRWDHHQRLITITIIITEYRMKWVRFTHNIFCH